MVKLLERVYQTIDGKLFTSLEEAYTHEKEQRLTGKVELAMSNIEREWGYEEFPSAGVLLQYMREAGLIITLKE